MAKRRVYEENAVITKTAELFARYGYRNITMQFLAEELGIAKPTLYVYGRSKQSLLDTVNIRFLEQVEIGLKLAQAEKGAGNQLRKVMHLWIELYAREWPSIRVYHAEIKEVSGPTREAIRVRSAKIVAALTTMVKKAQADGEIDPDLPPRFVVWTILGAINWMPRWYRSESWTPLQIGDFLTNMVFMKRAASSGR